MRRYTWLIVLMICGLMICGNTAMANTAIEVAVPTKIQKKDKVQIITNMEATFKSSNEKVALVDESGVITAKKKGKVRIIVTPQDETYGSTIVKVSVAKKAEQIHLEVNGVDCKVTGHTLEEPYFAKLNKAIVKKKLRNTYYGNIVCGEYVSRALKAAKIADGCWSRSADELEKQMNESDKWDRVTKPYIGDKKVTKKTWKKKVRKGNMLSVKSHEQIMKMIQEGTIKAGDVIFSVQRCDPSFDTYNHVAIVSNCLVKDVNEKETFVLDHATSYYISGALLTGRNGRGWGSWSFLTNRSGSSIGFVVYRYNGMDE